MRTKVFVRTPEGKRTLGRCRCEDNIKMGVKEVGSEGVSGSHVAQDKDNWRAVVNTVMNIQLHKKAGTFLPMAKRVTCTAHLILLDLTNSTCQTDLGADPKIPNVVEINSVVADVRCMDART
jgi:hypothetical protein